MQLPVYYINLDHRADRRLFMEEQFARLDIEATRISAVTAELAARYRPSGWQRGMGELGCTLSHQTAWNLLWASGAPAAVVLEDDAILANDFKQVIDGQWFRYPPELLKLETRGGTARLGRVRQKIADRYEARGLVSPHYGTCGYLISRVAARQAAEAVASFVLPVDHLLFGLEGPYLLRGRVQQIYPGACIPLDELDSHRSHQPAKSDIVADRIAITIDADRLARFRHYRRAFSQFLIAARDPEAFKKKQVSFADD